MRDWDYSDASFSPSPQPSPIKGEGVYGSAVLLSARPLTPRLRIKSAMTVLMAGMTDPTRHSCAGENPQGGVMGLSCSPSPQPSPIKGEGDSVGWFVLMSARPLTSGLRIKSAMTVLMAGMTGWGRHSCAGENPQGGVMGLSCSPSPQPSPIKGEGVYGCFVLLPPTLWILP